MAISNTMNFKVLTLIDITQTGQNKFKSEDPEATQSTSKLEYFLTGTRYESQSIL